MADARPHRRGTIAYLWIRPIIFVPRNMCNLFDGRGAINGYYG
jgi:hypothetical protein